jgi:hypothetical protein
MLCLVDRFTGEALAIRVARKLDSAEVIDLLADLFLTHGMPGHIHSDQGPEFLAEAVKAWNTGSGRGWRTLRRRARGRTGTWRASTASCGTNC